MIGSDSIFADFQFIGNRVSDFRIDTKNIETGQTKVKVSSNFDYKINDIKELENSYIGYIEFTTQIRARVKQSVLFKIDLTMEGAFAGNIKNLKREDFIKMLQLNGLTTLSQLSRAYILTVTALSGINPPVKLPMINIMKLIKQKEKQKTDAKPEPYK